MRVVLVVMMLFSAIPACAEDRWILLGEARGATVDCMPFHTWRAVAVAHNFSDAEVELRVVEVSNGVTPAAQAMHVPARASMLIPALDSLAFVPIFIARLEVPSGVRIESRLEYRYNSRR